MLLRLRGPTSADDANRIFVALGPDDKNQATRDGADSNKSVFDIGVSVVEDLEIIDAR